MGIGRNRQDEALHSLGFWKIKTTTKLINCLVCRKPRGGRPGYDSDHGRKFLFSYLSNTVCGRGLLTLPQELRPLTFNLLLTPRSVFAKVHSGRKLKTFTMSVRRWHWCTIVWQTYFNHVKFTKFNQLFAGKLLKFRPLDSDFRAKMHLNSISAEVPPQTPLGSLLRSPDHLAAFKGPTSKGRRERERGRKGKGKRGGGKGNLFSFKFRSGYATGHTC